MPRFILVLQVITIFVLFGEALYIATRRPSKIQLYLLITVFCTALMLVGYAVELSARDVSSAMTGVAFSYIGKPFALLTLLMFISDYCKRPIPRQIAIALFIFNLVFPIAVFFNSSTHLFYASVGFDRSNPFSPLSLTPGPLYYLYILKVICNFIWIFSLTVREYLRSNTREERTRVLLLFSAVASTILGYVVFVLIPRDDYDATMIGAILGIVFLSLLFFRHRLFDVLTLSKEQALYDANFGILVLDSSGRVQYSNGMMEKLVPGTFSLEEFSNLAFGKTLVRKDDFMYEVSRSSIVDDGWNFGQRIEITDVTVSVNYSQNLEREVQSRASEILRIQRSIVSSFAAIVDARDGSTGSHIKRICQYVDILVHSMRELDLYPDKLTDGFITSLVDVSPLHDIGKLSVPDSILLKPGALTDEEYKLMKTHPEKGAQIISDCLSGVERPEYVALGKELALYHHERWDGSGYPFGLKGEEIPLSAQILSVADVYDAIRSERVYKAPMSKEDARKVILEGRGTHFSPAVVDAFENAVEQMEAVPLDE